MPCVTSEPEMQSVDIYLIHIHVYKITSTVTELLRLGQLSTIGLYIAYVPILRYENNREITSNITNTLTFSKDSVAKHLVIFLIITSLQISLVYMCQ